MVEMRKGKKVLTVPAGAVKKYTLAGWELANSSKSVKKTATRNSSRSEDEKSLNDDNAESDDELDEDDEVEYVDPEELAQRPLNELDKEELKILAEYKGLDVGELSTAKQLRAALRALE